MGYSDKIITALTGVPSRISIPVLEDIVKRIGDWLLAGGSADDPYIEQQVRYAENVSKAYKGE